MNADLNCSIAVSVPGVLLSEQIDVLLELRVDPEVLGLSPRGENSLDFGEQLGDVRPIFSEALQL